jgi:hypothetical protein
MRVRVKRESRSEETSDVLRTIVLASVWLIATIIAISRGLSEEHMHWDGVRI